MTDLDGDPRWRRFNDRSFRCPCCGQSFNGVFDVSFDHPDGWPHGHRGASGEDVLAVGEDWLSRDFCVFGGDHFVRCVMPFPIAGTDGIFAFGVWGSVRQKNFEAHRAGFDTDEYGDFEGCFSWLCNILPCLGQEDPVPCDLRIENPAERPVLHAQAAGGTVRRHQDRGITFDQLLDIYAAAGQDIRPHLMDA